MKKNANTTIDVNDNPHNLPIGSEYREVVVTKEALKWLHGAAGDWTPKHYLNATIFAGELYLWAANGSNLHAYQPLFNEFVQIGTLDTHRIVPMVFDSARLINEIKFYGGKQVRFVFYRSANGGQWDGGCKIYIEVDSQQTNVTHIVEPLPNVDSVLSPDRLDEILKEHDSAFSSRQPMRAVLASGDALKKVFDHPWSPIVWQIKDVYVATELDAKNPSDSRMFSFFAKRGDLRGDV